MIIDLKKKTLFVDFFWEQYYIFVYFFCEFVMVGRRFVETFIMWVHVIHFQEF